MYHNTTSDNMRIDGILYSIVHTEGLAFDVIALNNIENNKIDHVGTLEIDHNTESALVRAANGQTVGVNYYEAGEADIYGAAHIVAANV